MDSVTQIALGASVAEAVLGRRIGSKAAMLGAVFGTLPDLDSFIPYQDAIATVSYHRSFSHSLIVLALLSPLFAWLVHWLARSSVVTFRQWWLLVFLVLVTHPLLDLFTVYGTQLLWPIYNHPFSGSTIFIIDPAYTMPLSIGVLTALFCRRTGRLRLWSNTLGLALSCLYLLWSVAAKFHIEAIIRTQLEEQAIAYHGLLSTPAPFNTVLWRLVAMTEGGYYEAYYSVLDDPHPVDFHFVADQKVLLEEIRDHWPVQRLNWFTQGFYAANRVDDAVVLSDLRMGVAGGYTFNFTVARIDQAGVHPQISTQVPMGFRPELMGELMSRLITPVIASGSQ